MSCPNHMSFTKIKMSDYTTVGLKPFVNALATRFDVWRSCKNNCAYCFARVVEFGALARLGIRYDKDVARVGDVPALIYRFQQIFDEKTINPHDYIDWCIAKRYAFESGTMGENFCEADYSIGLTRAFLELLNNYRFPAFFCTKGNTLVHDGIYYDLVANLRKYGLVMDISLISLNDEILKKWEPFSPLASERLKLIERLSDDGVNVVVSCRPFLSGVTDVDFEKYVEGICRAGAKSIHMRQFYISGLLAKRWKPWVQKHMDIMERYGIGWKYKHAYLDSWFKKAKEIADKYGVAITGGNEIALGKSHKSDFANLDDNVKKMLLPYTVLPIHDKLMDRKEPKILRYEEEMVPMLNADDPMLDADITIDRKSIILVIQRCCQMKPRTDTRHKFRDIVRRGIWDGWDLLSSKEFPAVASAYDIKPVLDNGKFALDEAGHKVYAFIPNLHEKCIEKSRLQEFGLKL